jgi:hypothetical protein
VLISVPLFNTDWNKNSEKAFELLDGIVNSLKELKIAKVDISKEIERSRIESFLKVIRDKIILTNHKIEENRENIESYSKKVIDLTKENMVNLVTIKNLDDLIKQDSNIITDQIVKLKKVPFVKEVVLTNDGIAVYIGEISIKYNKVAYNIGRFRIYIKPNEVDIYNIDAIRRGGGYYDHPHVDNTNPCLNTWKPKVNDLLAKVDFINLVVLLKMYLQSYNNDGNGVPFVSIEEWNKLREKQLLHLSDPIPEIGKEREYLDKIR